MDIKKTYPLVVRDAAQLCENDMPTELEAALASYPVLVELNDENGRTLLHHAAEAGSWGCVDVLIRKGANINAQDNLGETPLHRALVRNRVVATQVLLNNGANPNLCNFFGATPTLYAAQAGPDHYDLLVSKGGNANVVDKNGEGVEQWAERGQWLLERQAQVRSMRP